METLTNMWVFFKAHQEIILSILFYVFSIGSILVSAVRKHLSMQEAMILMINTLKDEDKMEANGAIFKEDTLKKIDKIAEVTQVGAQAIAEVKSVITTANTRDPSTANPGDIKLGSYNGKPVFISDAYTVGSKLVSALGILRGILRK